ncbi:MAG: hypothetical protein JNK04_15180, partial [Myxococcales bacterium]|nr:hypothetical protein [Myxococcales bacterium]
NGVTATLGARNLSVPAFPAHLVDAGGAGDWTTAGVLWRVMKSADRWNSAVVEDALRLGQALAAVSCGYAGARSVTSFLSRDEMVKAARDIMEHHALQPGEHALPRRARPPANGCIACLNA